MCHENCNRCERDHGHDHGSIGNFTLHIPMENEKTKNLVQRK